MALLKVNVGTGPDATPADPIRTAFQKHNANMDEIDGRLRDVTPYVHKGPWSPGTYEPRDVVTHNGSTWLTLVTTDEEPGLGSDWEVLAEKGETGDQGPVGATGATGAKGDKGDKGDTGSAGPQGASVQVILVEAVNWPPAADPNPLNVYVRVG